MEHVCPHCQAVFSQKRNLNKHLQTAYYCLQKRGIETTVCICGKSFLSEKILKKHETVCSAYIIDKKSKNLQEVYDKLVKDNKIALTNLNRELNDKNKEIERLKERVAFLEGKSEALVTQSRKTTINNQYTQLLTFPLDLSQKHIEEKSKKINLNILYKGQKGLADFFVDHIATNNKGDVGIICTDKNRGHFKYMNENGKIILDPEACTIIKEFKSHSRLNINKSLDRLWLDYEEEADNDEKRDKFDTYNKIADEVNEFGGPFVAQLVKRTYKKTEDGTLVAVEPPNRIPPHRRPDFYKDPEPKVVELTPQEEVQFAEWDKYMN